MTSTVLRCMKWIGKQKYFVLFISSEWRTAWTLYKLLLNKIVNHVYKREYDIYGDKNFNTYVNSTGIFVLWFLLIMVSTYHQKISQIRLWSCNSIFCVIVYIHGGSEVLYISVFHRLQCLCGSISTRLQHCYGNLVS